MNNSDLASLAETYDLSACTVAYFSMEIALDPSLPTYSGGLGILAGDTLRSAADTAADMVAVSLVHRRGYFRQHLDAAGQQTESDVPWSPETTLPSAGPTISLTMQNREVRIRAWRLDIVGVAGHVIPVLLLDSDVEGNDPWDRHLTDHLYGGDTYYRLCQETILGLGGLKMLDALGCRPEVYHMNEGHASLLAIGLLEQQAGDAGLAGATDAEADVVRQQCVFTTHTPVPAGHDQFGLDQMFQVLGQERAEAIERFGCLHNNLMNMTYIALRFARFVNGVSMRHGKVSQAMFPDYKIECDHQRRPRRHLAVEADAAAARSRSAAPGGRTTPTSGRCTGLRPRRSRPATVWPSRRLFASVAERFAVRVPERLRRGRTHPRSGRSSPSASRAASPPTSAPACCSPIPSGWCGSPRRSAACRSCSRARRIPPTSPARS